MTRDRIDNCILFKVDYCFNIMSSDGLVLYLNVGYGHRPPFIDLKLYI